MARTAAPSYLFRARTELLNADGAAARSNLLAGFGAGWARTAQAICRLAELSWRVAPSPNTTQRAQAAGQSFSALSDWIAPTRLSVPARLQRTQRKRARPLGRSPCSSLRSLRVDASTLPLRTR